MNKKILIVLGLILVYLGLTVALQPKLRQVLRAPEPSVSTTSQTPKPFETVAYDCQKGKNAFELLSQKTEGKLETKDYSFGKMINAIDGVKGGAEGKYWIYFVDGKSASVSADNYKCLGQEKVEWKLLPPQ